MLKNIYSSKRKYITLLLPLLYFMVLPLNSVNAQFMCTCDNGQKVQTTDCAFCNSGCHENGSANSISCSAEVFNPRGQEKGYDNAIFFTPQVNIGNFNKNENIVIGPSTIGEYINSIYKYAIGTVGILAVVVMMFGGILWVTAGGNQERIGSAKSWIGASLTGLVLTMASYTILNTINPDLVNFKPISPIEAGKMQKCCSSLRGAFPGFQTVVNGKQTYTCKANPVIISAGGYGNITECIGDEICDSSTGNCYNPNVGCCESQLEIPGKSLSTYVCKENVKKTDCKDDNINNIFPDIPDEAKVSWTVLKPLAHCVDYLAGSPGRGKSCKKK